MQKEVSDPNKLFDTIIKEARLKNDAELARSIGTSPSNISNMRAKRLQIGASILVKIMDQYGLSLKRIRALLD